MQETYQFWAHHFEYGSVHEAANPFLIFMTNLKMYIVKINVMSCQQFYLVLNVSCCVYAIHVPTCITL